MEVVEVHGVVTSSLVQLVTAVKQLQRQLKNREITLSVSVRARK